MAGARVLIILEVEGTRVELVTRNRLLSSALLNQNARARVEALLEQLVQEEDDEERIWARDVAEATEAEAAE